MNAETKFFFDHPLLNSQLKLLMTHLRAKFRHSLLWTTIKGLFTPNKSGSESEKDQTTSKKDQTINDKHQSKFSFLLRFCSVWMHLNTFVFRLKLDRHNYVKRRERFNLLQASKLSHVVRTCPCISDHTKRWFSINTLPCQQSFYLNDRCIYESVLVT